MKKLIGRGGKWTENEGVAQLCATLNFAPGAGLRAAPEPMARQRPTAGATRLGKRALDGRHAVP
jgi:hypothetical protein